eukprot:scaffold135697_cov34-Tisochrysis_lutea.AAC.2
MAEQVLVAYRRVLTRSRHAMDCRNVCWGGGSMLVEARHQKPTDARAASMYLGMAAMCAGRAAACSLSTST